MITSTPFRYPGGKACLAPTIATMLDINAPIRTIVAEPYAGAAGASVTLLLREYVDSILINDLDYRVFSAWWALLKHTQRFADLIASVPLTIGEWKRQREVYRSPGKHKRFDVGFATFYLNRTNRSGILVNGGPIGGINQKGIWKLDARFTRSALAKRVLRLGAYRDRINIFNLDAIAFIRSIDSIVHGRPVFLYLDPPYYVKGTELYLSSYSQRDHLRVSKTIQSIRNHPWALTYDDVPEVRRMYANCKITPFTLRYTAHSSRRGKELLITPRQLALSRT